MSYGKKCNMIFIRKVRRRIQELEDRHKNLEPKERAKLINKHLLDNFCVGLRQVRRWRKIVETADELKCDIDVTSEISIQPEEIPPTTLFHISRVPKEKQVEIVKKAVGEKLTTRQTKALVDQVLEIERKPKGPYVTESGVEWTDYCLNVYLGCSHNCKYCYAKMMNEKTRWVETWGKARKREINLEELSKELDGLAPGTLFFCSITDPYQPLEKQQKWSRNVLYTLLQKDHITTLILTKSSLVERDFDLIRNFKNVRVGFTITCLDDDKNKHYEPFSSPPSERIRVLKKAHLMGIKTFVSVEPWILGHTNPIDIVSKLKDFVGEWIFGIHNYADSEIKDYQPLIGELHTFLVKNNIKFRMKAELDRAFKSNPVLTRLEYLKSEEQMVGKK